METIVLHIIAIIIAEMTNFKVPENFNTVTCFCNRLVHLPLPPTIVITSAVRCIVPPCKATFHGIPLSVGWKMEQGYIRPFSCSHDPHYNARLPQCMHCIIMSALVLSLYTILLFHEVRLNTVMYWFSSKFQVTVQETQLLFHLYQEQRWYVCPNLDPTWMLSPFVSCQHDVDLS